MRLVADSVEVAFGATRVLRAVSLTVESAESLAIVGPSGSGKSTLLAVLGGLLRPDAGRVEVDGAHVGVADVVAWVHQVPVALRSRRLVDNVALGALAAGCDRSQAEATAVDLLERLGLTGRGNTAARRVSGGELQRVAIGRALAVGARFVLADEPTGQLDRATSDEVCRLLVDVGVRQMGRALVVVTHDESVAARCDRTVRLTDGALIP